MRTYAKDKAMLTKGEFFAGTDRYVYYGDEDVLFFSDAAAGKVWMKFVGKVHDVEVPHDQRLFNDAIRFGREVTRAEYQAGAIAD